MTEQTSNIDSPSFPDLFASKVEWIRQSHFCYGCSVRERCCCFEDQGDCYHNRLSAASTWLQEMCSINRCQPITQIDLIIDSLNMTIDDNDDVEDGSTYPVKLILDCAENLKIAALLQENKK